MTSGSGRAKLLACVSGAAAELVLVPELLRLLVTARARLDGAATLRSWPGGAPLRRPLERAWPQIRVRRYG